MANEDPKVRHLREWTNNFAGAKPHLPALMKMRTGPFKDFVDKHLVPSIRSEEWVKTMKAHFRLIELRQEVINAQEALENDKEKLRLLKETHSELRAQEEKLESQSAEELFRLVSAQNEIPKWSTVQDKASILEEEARLRSANLVIWKSEDVRSTIESLVRHTVNELTTTAAPSCDSHSNTDKLSSVKAALSLSLLPAANDDLRQNSFKMGANAVKALTVLITENPQKTRSWCGTDLEDDKRAFLKEVQEMKEDEKVSLIQKLVYDWSHLHVQLCFENDTLNKSLDKCKEKLHQTKSALLTKSDLEPILDALLAEKEAEHTFRYYHKIRNSSPNSALDHHLDGKPSRKRKKTDDEFNLNLVCSLFKTWPNAKFVYHKEVEDVRQAKPQYADACKKVLRELHLTLESLSRNSLPNATTNN